MITALEKHCRGLLVGSLAMPVPASESAAIIGFKSSVNSHRANGFALRCSRIRPTYGDSIQCRMILLRYP